MYDLMFGIIEESTYIDSANKLYDIMKESYRKRFNLSLGLILWPQEDIDKIRDDIDLPEPMDLFAFPIQAETLFSPQKKSRITGAYDSIATVIVSSVPEMTKKPSLSFLSMDGQFAILWMTSLLAVSIIMALATLRKQNGRTFVSAVVDMLWRNFLLFFFEPFESVMKAMSWRVAAMSWFIGITFIYFEISGKLKSDFTEKEYDTVDTIEQLLQQDFHNVWFFEGSDEFISLRRKAMSNVKKYGKLLEGIPSTSMLSVGSGVMGTEFAYVAKAKGRDRKFMVLSTILLQFMLSENMEISNKMEFADKYYVSPPVENNYVVFAVSYNFSRSKYMDNVNLMLQLLVENDLAFIFQYKPRYSLDVVQWKNSQDDFSLISVKEIESLILVYFVGIAIAILAMILELALSFLMSLKKSRTQRKLGREINLHALFY